MPEDLKDKEQAKKEPAAAAEKKKERPTNCATCNKAFKHKHWYYKNGKYFCTKRCWEKLSAEIKAKAAEAKAKEVEAKAKEAESSEPAKSPENPAA
jgi:hypothetical protein